MGTDVDEIFDEELADELLTDGENLFDDIEFEDDNPDNSDSIPVVVFPQFGSILPRRKNSERPHSA